MKDSFDTAIASAFAAMREVCGALGALLGDESKTAFDAVATAGEASWHL